MKNNKPKKKNKFKNIFQNKGFKIFKQAIWPVFYFIVACAFCVGGCLIFHNKYYTSIYVSGQSMQPTLNDRENSNLVDFGIADTSTKAISNIKRFDVIITVYTFDEKTDDSLKIKRVWGLPGETISLEKDIENEQFVFTVYKQEELIDEYKISYHVDDPSIPDGKQFLTVNVHDEKEFLIKRKTSPEGRAIKDREFCKQYIQDKVIDNRVVLNEDEYFVMGDNWTGSSDCYTHKCTPLHRSDLRGVVVAIEGVAKLVNGQLVDKKYLKPRVKF